MLEAVEPDLIHSLKLLSEFAPRKPFAGKPFKIGYRQIAYERILEPAKRHSCRDHTGKDLTAIVLHPYFLVSEIPVGEITISFCLYSVPMVILKVFLLIPKKAYMSSGSDLS